MDVVANQAKTVEIYYNIYNNLLYYDIYIYVNPETRLQLEVDVVANQAKTVEIYYNIYNNLLYYDIYIYVNPETRLEFEVDVVTYQAHVQQLPPLARLPRRRLRPRRRRPPHPACRVRVRIAERYCQHCIAVSLTLYALLLGSYYSMPVLLYH